MHLRAPVNGGFRGSGICYSLWNFTVGMPTICMLEALHQGYQLYEIMAM
ncbi:MAG: hypothetical protein VX643_04265 [Chloroflexota bacterium]|nr:hypothetical protein [Chloroflexota bacterium]